MGELLISLFEEVLAGKSHPAVALHRLLPDILVQSRQESLVVPQREFLCPHRARLRRRWSAVCH